MKEIELPFDFNAFNSDLEEYRISIPEGFKAQISGNEVILKKNINNNNTLDSLPTFDDAQGTPVINNLRY